MKVQEITLPPAHKRLLQTGVNRCSKTVKTGTAFNPTVCTCKRFANFRIDGNLFCTQHAGDVALRHLIDDTAANTAK